jgi:TonB-linked SusC/RagA family outer membrane protein
LHNVTVKDVLNEIEKNSSYKFIYRNEFVDVQQIVNINAKEETLETIMAKLFSSESIAYRVFEDNIVVITDKSLQKIKITGTVTDGTTGEALPGVNVIIQGTTSGVTTDINGKYTIEVPNNETVLVFSFIGYNAESIPVAGKNTIDVNLIPDIQSLKEVVVVGYGTMRKKDLTGSITQIRPEKLEKENPKTVQDILRGTPGLSVGYDASAKGGGSMQLRGQRSVYTDGGHNDPLIILDGITFFGELSEINPDDISQIDVLKDASSAAIYGSRAASGVIIITTKKGKQGKPVVNITSNIGIVTKSDYRGVFGPEGYMKFREDWYKKDSYGLNSATGNYEAYQAGATLGKPGYYDNPSNLAKYGVSLDNWRAYTTNTAGESDASIYARRLNLSDIVLKNYLAGQSFDWYDHTFRTGINQDYNASISGANEKMNYYLSFGYLNNEGAVVGNEYKTIRSNMKVEGKVNKWLEIGANVNFQNRTDGDIQPGLGTNYWDANQIKLSPYASHHDTLGNPVREPMGSTQGYHYNYDYNRQFMDLDKGYMVLNNILYAKIKLPFNITYSFNAEPRYQYFHDRYFESSKNPDWKATGGLVNREQTKRFDWSLNNTINWDYTLLEKHHIILTLVQEAEERQSWKDRVEARNILPSDALGYHMDTNGDKTKSTFSSDDYHGTSDGYLARLHYSFKERYFLTASMRRDGYSAFGENQRYGYFPSAGVAWSFINENFFKWTPMSTGKLRISYGKNGNRTLNDPYVWMANLSSGTTTEGYLDASGNLVQMRLLKVDRMSNPNLKWENTEAYNYALDFGFFDNRISGSIEYYHMVTNNMILPHVLPGFAGFTTITTNLGEVVNKGFEFSINSLNIKNSVLEWSTTFNFSYNKNEIRHLYYDYENVLDADGNIIGTKEMDDKTSRDGKGWFVGEPISTIWNYRVTGIWQASEIDEAKKYGQKPGDPKVANNYTADDIVKTDGTVTPVYNDKDKEFLGQETPPINWMLRNDFTLWKNLDISFNIYSYMGHKSLSGNYLNRDNDGSLITNMMNTFSKEYWTPENPTNKYARLDAQGPAGATSPSKLYNRSFIRLDNISVGYSLPKKLIEAYNIEKVKVFCSIQNVATWQKDWEYGDPETSGLATRIFSFGLNLTF